MLITPLLIFIAIITVSLLIGPKKNFVPLYTLKNDIKKYSQNFNGSQMPNISSIKVRDGSDIFYRHYLADNNSINYVAILVHGSSANSKSLHLMSDFLSKNGIEIYSLDVRGHGNAGKKGTIEYIGQLEDDLEDLVAYINLNTKNKKLALVGFSSGGGFALRVASEELSKYFDSFIALSPMISPYAPTYRKNSGGWAFPAVPRIIALLFLSKIGIKFFNYLSVINFALDQESVSKMDLVDHYSFNLQQNYGLPAVGYKDYIKAIEKPTYILIGGNDDMFYANQYEPLVKKLSQNIEVKVIDGLGHIDMSMSEISFKAILSIFDK